MRITGIINLMSLPSLSLRVTYILINRKKNTLAENDYIELS